MTPRRLGGHQGAASAAHAAEGVASDAGIMARLARGESSALGELYDRHQARLRRFVARATGDAEDVDDLVHATFLAAADIAARYDGRASCHPWLIGIAAQLLRRRRRAFGRFLAVLSSVRGGGGAGRGGAGSGSSEAGTAALDPRPALLARTDVERALRRISEPKRVAFLMAEVEGLSCPEIAAALQIPLGTVWTRLHAARRELRRLLDGGEP